ncbi:helix-turn-helix domain-containing protein [Martelella soudanensis]|uniref:helix-turn-helix domain-containing protein n=1 Tax=unclassified Martelella TaxID=2629616 RepID=UPI0015DFDC58|nr:MULTISPECIES: helix-turn-helix transcriptional regulator [unclassified Martelella]
MDEEFYADDTLGGRLLAARESAGLSLDAAAERLGVTPLTLRNWECDRCEPTVERLVRMADILGVRPFWLISGDWEQDCAETERNLTDMVMGINRVGKTCRRGSDSDAGGAVSLTRAVALAAGNRTLQ